MENLTYEEKFHKFSKIISTRSMQGFLIADRNDRELVAVLIKSGEEVNHLLHFVIFFFSCGLWLIVWIILVLSKKKEIRIRISIDNVGNVIEERIRV